MIGSLWMKGTSLLDERLHDQVLERGSVGAELAEWNLHHPDGDQLLLGIHPKVGPVRTRPRVLADRPGMISDASRLPHRKAESESIAGHRRELHVAEVIGCHELNRLPAQKTCAVELTSVED